jgi:hypothetical protein
MVRDAEHLSIEVVRVLEPPTPCFPMGGEAMPANTPTDKDASTDNQPTRKEETPE